MTSMPRMVSTTSPWSLSPGRTLDQCIERKGLHVREVLKYGIQIADALSAAHTAGIVHRDLKPANVMISERGLLKLLDFGLAKLAEPLESDVNAATATIRMEQEPQTEEGTIVGTVAYMSPEQAEGKKVDARTDIFSFGSLLYEMITGRRAFHAPTRMAILSAILEKDPPPAERNCSAGTARTGESDCPLYAQGPRAAIPRHGRYQSGAAGTAGGVCSRARRSRQHCTSRSKRRHGLSPRQAFCCCSPASRLAGESHKQKKEGRRRAWC